MQRLIRGFIVGLSAFGIIVLQCQCSCKAFSTPVDARGCLATPRFPKEPGTSLSRLQENWQLLVAEDSDLF